MHDDTKFILLIVSFILACIGLMILWNQPTPCQEQEYQDLTGTHSQVVCS